MRASSTCVITAIGTTYMEYLEHFTMDEHDAFQSTPANAKGMPDMFYQQARGFVEYGPNGEKLVCKRRIAHQGSIDASALFC